MINNETMSELKALVKRDLAIIQQNSDIILESESCNALLDLIAILEKAKNKIQETKKKNKINHNPVEE